MTRFLALLAISAVAVFQTQTAVAGEAAPELNDQERAQLGKALEGLQPLAIEREEDGSLIVVLPHNRVRFGMLSSVVRAGICFGKLAQGYEIEFQDVAVVNRFVHQGYVWEGNLKDCDELNTLPNSEAKQSFLLKTVGYVPGSLRKLYDDQSNAASAVSADVAGDAAPELDDREQAALGRVLEGWQPLAVEREESGRLVVVLPTRLSGLSLGGYSLRLRRDQLPPNRSC